MAIPSFTAETSLYRTQRSFRTGNAPGVIAAGIQPMQEGTHCGNCHCKAGAKCHHDPSTGFCHCHPPGHEAAETVPDAVFLTR